MYNHTALIHQKSHPMEVVERKLAPMSRENVWAASLKWLNRVYRSHITIIVLC